ncbi:MAG: mechanosensitive ion channel family protein, partial [Candidatus ainarchaeum sp.]|nr:mechanosensitive ion channel family protein [Candidatus ainarchaeum sp.]
MIYLAFLEPYLGEEFISSLSSLNPIILSSLILISSFILATIVLFVIRFVGGKIAARTSVKFDDEIVKAIQPPSFRLIILGGVYLSVLTLQFDPTVSTIMLNIIQSIAYIVVFLFIGRIFDIFLIHGLTDLSNKTGSKIDSEILPLFQKTMSVVIWIFGFIIILNVWGIDIGPLLAGVGIAGLAVSFALQSTLSNIFAGVSIILDKTFKVGDKIELESGEVGIINDITLRSTRITTYNNEVLVLPNDALA